ncbi:hypothetical protein J18TS1_32810 [Oceanobacillus oncorhynchi subsp. incaldanensis]|uniref:DUF2812 domain-containing protein n=1 Tax=Oceanobacillus oncorhynchi TaxID=545501 RepID=A0A0A1MMM4_9BACI|nr:DUF2812 domain-containing protein [Oceanobacillus oncorhynchi]GIO20181.1 hypothetical protein J18TS1_32810 [Oceanobacillus oncorhynchi subsp. incaldanensis]CEI80331.1 hypothetical protein BN997_00134 [Oceanobacillus oncorhynchi]
MKKKLIWNPARFFFHYIGTEKLEALAKEGWVVERLRLGGLLFQLTEDKPKEVQYHLEFQPIQKVEEDTPPLEEGWELVDTVDYTQVYQGSSEALPKETSYELLLGQLRQEGYSLGKYTIISILFLVSFFILHMRADWALVQMILLGGIMMLSITAILMLTLYIVNKFRQHNLKNM